VVIRFIQFTFLCMTSSRDTARHSAGFGLMPFYNRVLEPLNGQGLTRKYASSDPETSSPNAESLETHPLRQQVLNMSLKHSRQMISIRFYYLDLKHLISVQLWVRFRMTVCVCSVCTVYCVLLTLCTVQTR